MQEIKREVLVEKAKELLANGTVDRVLGWKRDEDPDNNFDWNITPAIFRTAEEIDRDFVWNDFCGANFSKYLIKETIGKDAKVLVFLKPCDTYSFNQLLTEHRFDREKVYAVGVPCNGMVDINKIKAVAGDDVTSVDDGEKLTVHTLYDGDVTIDAKDVLPDRCLNCKSKKHVAYDELLGEDGEVIDSNRFDEVEKLER
ncbi:MAG: Coenzyme F420 hydrogenase/dehydrogenase, beta subunit C-terminal domain [Eubacteriales bacterium]